MNKWYFIIVVIMGLGAGCQKPTEVQLTSDNGIVIESVTEPDPSVDREPVDSTGLLPRDGERFAAFISLTSIKTDLGPTVESRTVARVVFENRLRPIIVDGKKRFFGLPLGTVFVSLGGSTDILFPRDRRIGLQTYGIEYVRELAAYVPRGTYRFTTTGSDSVGAFTTTVEAPEMLTVLAPRGGQRFPRNRDLELRWQGNGQLNIILSAVELRGAVPRLIPIFNVMPKQNIGRALLSKRVLQGLPAGIYVFTFALTNRDERLPVANFRGKVLVQASSIYNVRFDLF